jgi:hypothetical protein
MNIAEEIVNLDAHQWTRTQPVVIQNAISQQHTGDHNRLATRQGFSWMRSWQGRGRGLASERANALVH